MEDERSIFEEILVLSRHVRLARLRSPTSCRLIPQLSDRLMRSLAEYQVVAGKREIQFCMALEEALNNAFYHGNLELSSQLKEDGSSRFIELAAEREALSPWRERSVQVTELVSVFGLWLTIQDSGTGFDVQAMEERCNDPELMFASGRDLTLMHAFADEIFLIAREIPSHLYCMRTERSENCRWGHRRLEETAAALSRDARI